MNKKRRNFSNVDVSEMLYGEPLERPGVKVQNIEKIENVTFNEIGQQIEEISSDLKKIIQLLEPKKEEHHEF